MRTPNGRGPPSPDARNDPPIDQEQPAKVLDGQFNQPPLPSQDEAAPPTAVDDASDISAIACAFGHEDLLGTVVNMADWGASHLRSASESAWRGDVAMAGDHLRRAANAIKATQMTYAVIKGEKAKAANDEAAPA
jgi:hypothetical protein